MGARAHPIFKFPNEIQQKPRDRAKVWKKKMNLEHFRKNCSKSNEKCMLLEFPVPKSKFDFFSSIFSKDACNDSEKVAH